MKQITIQSSDFAFVNGARVSFNRMTKMMVHDPADVTLKKKRGDEIQRAKKAEWVSQLERAAREAALREAAEVAATMGALATAASILALIPKDGEKP